MAKIAFKKVIPSLKYTKLFSLFASSAVVGLSAILPISAFAEIAGHRYLWMNMVYNFTTESQTIGGDEINCTTDYFGNTNCTKSPSYTIPGSSSSQVLRVHVDCTDQTYDAKGDKRKWQSWRMDAEVYKAAMQRCFGR